MKPTVTTRVDFFLSLALIALGVFAAMEAWRMPRLQHLGVNIYSVPGIVPGLIGAIIAILGVVMLARSLWFRGWDLRGAGGQVAAWFEGPGTRRLLVTLVLTLGYAGGLVGAIPFWLATFLFVWAFVVIFEWAQAESPPRPPVRDADLATRPGREWPRLRVVLGGLVLAALVAASVTVVFERIFLVRLP